MIPHILSSEKKQEQYKQLLQYNTNHDIPHQGPLTSFSFSILGWMMLIFYSLAFVINHEVGFGYLPQNLSGIGKVLEYLGTLSVTFFLTSRVGRFFHRDDGFLRFIIIYAAMALGIAVGATYLYYHYLGSIFTHLFRWDFATFSNFVDPIISDALGKKINFNFFIDMLLIALLQFFALYSNPKWTKIQTILFRSLILFPIAYSITGFVLKYLGVAEVLSLPFLLYLYLPSGSPLTVVAFLLIISSQIRLKKNYIKAGGTQDQYDEYAKTRHYSWKMAKKIARHFFFVGLLDLLLSFLLFSVNQGSTIRPTSGSNQTDSTGLEMSDTSTSEVMSSSEPGATNLSTPETEIQGTSSSKDSQFESLSFLYSLFSKDAHSSKTLLQKVQDWLTDTPEANTPSTQDIMARMGAGDLSNYIIFAPLMLLFSLNKKPRSSQWKILVPILGIAAILVILGEGALCHILGMIDSLY